MQELLSTSTPQQARDLLKDNFFDYAEKTSAEGKGIWLLYYHHREGGLTSPKELASLKIGARAITDVIPCASLKNLLQQVTDILIRKSKDTQAETLIQAAADSGDFSKVLDAWHKARKDGIMTNIDLEWEEQPTVVL